MKKKLLIISTIVAAIIVLGSCSTSITASNLGENASLETVNIIVNKYIGNPTQTIETEVTIEEAEEIKEILTKLNEAITNNDKEAISFYEKQINNKDIFDGKYQEFYTNDEYNKIIEKSKSSKLFKMLGDKNGEDVSNVLCLFNAIGNGLFVSYLGSLALEGFINLLENASSFAEMFVIIIVFLPLVLIVIVFTGFIPIRILMPRGHVYLEGGRMSTIGLGGVKRATVDTEPITVNLSFFTGLSISIPGNDESGRDAFVFASGIAIRVEQID